MSDRTITILEAVVKKLNKDGYAEAACIINEVIGIDEEVDSGYMDWNDWEDFDVTEYVNDVVQDVESIVR